MAQPHKVAIIGLGVIGQRMLTNMPNQGRLQIVGGWDLDPDARAEAKRKFPWLAIADSAEALIASPDTDLVYIGVPPNAHREYALAAIDAGKAVFCEKPLGIDIDESRDLSERMEASGLKQAVNFVFGAARGAETIKAALDAGEAGDIAGVDIRLHFAKWPRGWQENAAWLGRREQGGFVREVLSHYVFLTEKLFGASELVSASVAYPALPEGAAETHVLAQLDCSGTPVTFAGTVGGAGPDLVEYTVWGARKSYRLAEWYRLVVSDGGDWADVVAGVGNLPLDSYMLQLDNLVAMLDGRPHMLPDFRAALSVQERIEEILAEG
jgi:predicted dehydrogenase